MTASSSRMRASIIPCSFLAAWYSKFSDRSPSSRAALILATIDGRLTVVSSCCSFSTAARPSGVLCTSSAIEPSLNRDQYWARPYTVSGDEKDDPHGRDGTVGNGHLQRRRRHTCLTLVSRPRP